MMGWLRNVLLLILLQSSFHTNAQKDSAIIHQILQRIASQQLTTEEGYTRGNFPSFISNKKHFSERKRDDNIFFAALINYTLHHSYEYLSKSDQQLVDSIQQRTAGLYKHFQNQNGRLSFNFWRTDTAFVFPYTWWIHRLKKNTSLPDDIDDTVLSLMVQDCDSTRAAEAHAIMQEYSNHSRKAKTIEKRYRNHKAYSVWYGRRFPPVFDVCVLSNVLSFVQQYHLDWTSADSASLYVILQSIKSNDYIDKPLYVSPYYGNTSLILYHFARLMSYGNIPQLEALKDELVNTALLQFNHSTDVLEKVILSSAIMKWNVAPPPLSIPFDNKTISDIEHSRFPFFTGNIPSYFPLFYKHLFSKEGWLLFYHYCPSFNDALLLEYLLAKQKAN